MKIDELRLIKKSTSKSRMFSKTIKFSEDERSTRQLNRWKIERTISKSGDYERIVDEGVVSFLKEGHLMRASFS